MVYTIIKFTEKLFYYKSWLPYAGKIKLDVLLKEKRAYVFPLKEVSLVVSNSGQQRRESLKTQNLSELFHILPLIIKLPTYAA
jgi:hypothetical protein